MPLSSLSSLLHLSSLAALPGHKSNVMIIVDEFLQYTVQRHQFSLRSGSRRRGHLTPPWRERFTPLTNLQLSDRRVLPASVSAFR